MGFETVALLLGLTSKRSIFPIQSMEQSARDTTGLPKIIYAAGYVFTPAATAHMTLSMHMP